MTEVVKRTRWKNTAERERGRSHAVDDQARINCAVVKYEDIAKLRTLLDNFLEVNPNNTIDVVPPGSFNRHAVINNLEDVAFVLGYLEGLST
jgi:hypothetical protein